MYGGCTDMQEAYRCIGECTDVLMDEQMYVGVHMYKGMLWFFGDTQTGRGCMGMYICMGTYRYIGDVQMYGRHTDIWGMYGGIQLYGECTDAWGAYICMGAHSCIGEVQMCGGHTDTPRHTDSQIYPPHAC